MTTLILIISVVLLSLALKSHTMTHVHAIKKVERVWWERLFTGSRHTKDNLTEEGQKYRRQSNMYLIAGLVVLAVYVMLRSKG